MIIWYLLGVISAYAGGFYVCKESMKNEILKLCQEIESLKRIINKLKR